MHAILRLVSRDGMLDSTYKLDIGVVLIAPNSPGALVNHLEKKYNKANSIRTSSQDLPEGHKKSLPLCKVDKCVISSKAGEMRNGHRWFTQLFSYGT